MWTVKTYKNKHIYVIYIDNLSLNNKTLPCKSNISQFENNRLFTLKGTKNSMSKMKSQQIGKPWQSTRSGLQLVLAGKTRSWSKIWVCKTVLLANQGGRISYFSVFKSCKMSCQAVNAIYDNAKNKKKK